MTVGGAGPRLVLVGPMGAGKTTVGRALARRWDIAFRDTDDDVEQTARKSISEIFVDDGEQHFRTLEADAVVAALAEHDGILALGGGAVMTPAVREALDGHTVVFLSVGLSDAVKRVGVGAGRPLLLGGVRSRMKALLDERTPVYRSVAVLEADTDGKTPEVVADEVADLLEGWHRPVADPDEPEPLR